MKSFRSEPGLYVSALAHAALLGATLVAFSDTKKFEDAQEAIAVEVLTQSDLNQIMRGDKAGKPAEKPQTKVDKVAEITEQKPATPTEQAVRDVPVPPPPLKRIPDPEDDEEPPKPAPKPVAVVTPPPRPLEKTPEPPKPEPPKPLPRPEPAKVEPPKKEPEPLKEAAPAPIPPKKPPPPEPKKEAEAKPVPPVKPRPVEKKPEEAKPKAPEKPKLDEVAKLLAEKKRDDEKKVAEARPAKPRSGDEQAEPQRKFSPGDISKLLSKEKPQQTGSTGREPSKTASLGSATANAPTMSPSLWGQLDGWLIDQYKRCWSNNSVGGGQRYVAQIRVLYNADGSLSGTPQLVNPPSDPALRAVADSAMRAVKICNPLRVPEKFAPFHEQWRARTLRFDPEEMT